MPSASSDRPRHPTQRRATDPDPACRQRMRAAARTIPEQIDGTCRIVEPKRVRRIDRWRERREPQRFPQRCGPSAAGALVRSREAQRRRRAREARVVITLAASVRAERARHAQRVTRRQPALRASQGTPREAGGCAPARPRPTARAFARAAFARAAVARAAVARADSAYPDLPHAASSRAPLEASR